jgi:hypothetical protein
MQQGRTHTTLNVEGLEDRTVPAVITVTGTGDTIARDGVVTLREAITAALTHHRVGDAPAGSSSGINTIRFNIRGGGVHTIALRSALPTLTKSVVIDGTSQPGYRGKPLIQIDGTRAGSAANGLVLAGGRSTVRGLLINHFRGSAVVVSSGYNVVAGNYIGIDSTGFFQPGNGGDGIRVTGAHNVIGGLGIRDRNLIGGNKGAGVDLTGAGAAYNTVEGNYVGTDGFGFASLGNRVGVLVQARANHNLIGGTAKAARNVISGNLSDEVQITGAGTTANRVQGNYIGPDATGKYAPLSGRDGVRIAAGATYNIIGGTAYGSGNLISGNGVATGAGVTITGRGTSHNTVQGNWVGLDASGYAPLQNASGGILVTGGASGNTVGGRSRAAWNVIGDRPNASGLSSTNHVLGAWWYVDSIHLRPSTLGGTFTFRA